MLHAAAIVRSATEHRTLENCIGASRLAQLEFRNGHLRRHRIEYDFDFVADLYRVVIDADYIAVQAGTLLELYQRDVIGNVFGKRLVVQLMEHDVRKHFAAPRQRRPCKLIGQTIRAHVADRVTDMAARTAFLQLQPALLAAVPEATIVVRDRGQRFFILGHDHPFRRIVAFDVLSAAPRPVTRQTSASLTWRSPHSPRIWRAP